MQSKQSHLRDRAPTPGFRQRAAFLEQAQCFLRHRLVEFPFLRLLQVHRDHSGANSRLGFQRRLLRLVRKGFVVSESVRFPPARECDRAGRETRIVAIRVRIFYLGDLLIKGLRFVFAVHVLETTRFEIPGGEGQGRFLRFRCGAMKQGKRPGVILLGEQDLRDPIGRGPGEFTVAIIIQHTLKIGPGGAAAIERAITLRQVKISARSAGSAGILTQEFFVFRDRPDHRASSKKARWRNRADAGPALRCW